MLPVKLYDMPLTDASRIIGSVASVESERIVIQLDEAAPALVKAGSSGLLPVGAINSYLTIDAGPHRIVALITAVRIVENRSRRDEPLDDLSASRFIDATLIGRFEAGRFTPGLATFPSLFAPVAAASPAEIQRIFCPSNKFMLRLGEAVVAPEQDVLLDPDALLTRHFAVLGSTGSGKSCTVSAILEAFAEQDTPSASVLIFDANGEYTSIAADGNHPWHTLRLGLSDEYSDARLIAPHWLMNLREHSELFGASGAVQEPLLQKAILEAKLKQGSPGNVIFRLDLIRVALRDIRALYQANSGTVQTQLSGLLEPLEHRLTQLQSEANSNPAFASLAASISGWRKLGLVDVRDDGRPNWDKLNIDQLGRLSRLIEESEGIVDGALRDLGVADTSEGNADAPAYYSLQQLLADDLPRVIAFEAANDAKVRNFAAPLLLRIGRLLSDDRYAFIAKVPPLEYGLESFLRLLLGQWPSMKETDPWRFNREVPSARFQAVVLDLSEVSSDVLSAVTSLLGRIVIEFAQRCRPRANYPILLVLEEAHRYVPARGPDDNAFGRANVFERIAKEGRKFGVSLCVSSQRPSELSRTVISQCGTLIVHRIVNPDDQDLIRFASPVASRDVLKQLPSLARQHAVVLGEAVPAPTYVRIRDVENPPFGGDPTFMKAWRKKPQEEDAAELVRVASGWTSVRAQQIIGPPA